MLDAGAPVRHPPGAPRTSLGAARLLAPLAELRADPRARGEVLGLCPRHMVVCLSPLHAVQGRTQAPACPRNFPFPLKIQDTGLPGTFQVLLTQWQKALFVQLKVGNGGLGT